MGVSHRRDTDIACLQGCKGRTARHAMAPPDATCAYVRAPRLRGTVAADIARHSAPNCAASAPGGENPMMLSRRRFLHGVSAAAAAGMAAPARVARAQAWPSRPVRLVVGFPAGGGA